MRAQLLFDGLLLINDQLSACGGTRADKAPPVEESSDDDVSDEQPEDISPCPVDILDFDIFQRKVDENSRGVKRKHPSCCTYEEDGYRSAPTPTLSEPLPSPTEQKKKIRSDTVHTKSSFYRQTNKRKHPLTVTFNPSVRVDFVDPVELEDDKNCLPFDGMVPNQSSRLSTTMEKYYQKDEIQQMKTEARKMCKSLRKIKLIGGDDDLVIEGKEFKGESFRGLEHFCCNPSTAKERMIQKKLSILAVIQEQDRIQSDSPASSEDSDDISVSSLDNKIDEESQNCTRLAKVYAPLTKVAVDYSLHLASQDELAAKAIQKER